MTDLVINSSRLNQFIEQMAQIGATAAGGCNRQALTALDAQGRALFLEWCAQIGGKPRRDQMGNLFVRFEGSRPDLKPILLGSHLDTQPTGGRFDGVYGVLAALEVMMTLHQQQTVFQHPVDLAVWTNEEGARFAPAMMGSGVFAGVFEQDAMEQVTDSDGVSVSEALTQTGERGELPCQAFAFHGSLELHIEQGPVLEKAQLAIGQVTGVQGMNWFTVTLEGQSVHAGPTPMSMRIDPVQAFMKLLPKLYQLVADDEQARLTIGRIDTYPRAPNTVPEQVQFTVDLRHPQQEQLDQLSAQLIALCEFNRDGFQGRIEPLWQSNAVAFDPLCIEAVGTACEQLGYDYQPIVSGAGHDSVYLSQVGRCGMIFIPCRDGISHNEQEYASPSHVAQGANVLLHAFLQLDQKES
ncbi:Zn-dependent hydrolase [Celerinatantimonas sp. YJH-8]|uniref:Zn-dependent hydrolase n=1 Tax=Celerinatantimonas sp. YJH-8 TaxID=3228714 RepID=UPI0038BF3743